ncbi:MAG: pyridoxal-phosphate dependent enzyme, partial [Gaiella sp.]
QGTVGLEILEDVPDVDVIIVPTGGGGLVSGIAAAVGELGVRVVAVEPVDSAALAAALEAGEPVPVTPVTVADGLAAPFAGANALAVCQANGVESVLVTEGAIATAMRRCYAEAKLACEPAAAAGLAALAAGLVDARRPVVVVSGGSVAPRIASDILAGS